MQHFANYAQTALDGSIDDSQTTVTVADASSFPTEGNFTLTLGSEYVLVTSRSGNTLTVTRGVEGSTPVAHEDGAKVSLLLTAGSLEGYFNNNYGWGTLTNRPSTPYAGMVYFCTDFPAIFVYDGSDWQAYGPVYYLKTPPSSGWSWAAQGSTHSISADVRGISILSSEPEDVSARYERDLTYTSAFSLETGIIQNYAVGSSVKGYLYIGKAGTGYVRIDLMVTSFTSSHGIIIRRLDGSWSSVSSTVTTVHQSNTWISPIHFFKFQYDGTNVNVYISNDRVNWSRIVTEAASTYFSSDTPEVFGFSFYQNDANHYGGALTLVHFDEVDES